MSTIVAWFLVIVSGPTLRWQMVPLCHLSQHHKSNIFMKLVFSPNYFHSFFFTFHKWKKKRRRMWMCLRLSRGAWRRNIRCAWSVRSTGMDEADGFRLFRFTSNVVVFGRTLSLFLSFVIFVLFCVCFLFFVRNVWIFLVNFWFPDYC